MASSLIVDVFQIAVLIYSVVLHELAHGLMARSLGDHTAERMGRLTLNPLKHLDLFGSFILPLLSLALGGFMFGYAKPVPYDPAKLRDRATGPSKVALAGPLTNLLLAALFGLLIRLLGGILSENVLSLVGYIVWINIVLAVFNLIPVPPLDGHWLLMTLLPARFTALKIALYRYQLLFLLFVLFVVFPALAPLLGRLFLLLTGMRLF